MQGLQNIYDKEWTNKAFIYSNFLTNQISAPRFVLFSSEETL